MEGTADKVSLKILARKGLEALKGLSTIHNKFEVILHILGLNRKKFVKYILNNGLIFIAPNLKKDRTLILSLNEIIRENIYSAESSTEKKVILDLGANAGVFSIFSAKLNPRAIIYAFEPDKNTFNQLKENIRINNMEKRVFPLNLAVSNITGQVSFFVDNLTTRGSSMFRNVGVENRVDSISLKKAMHDFKIKKCDVIKMDIEGAEYEVIYNFPEKMLKSVDKIFVEVHSGFEVLSKSYNFTEMKKFLLRKGFDIVKENENIISAVRQDAKKHVKVYESLKINHE